MSAMLLKLRRRSRVLASGVGAKVELIDSSIQESRSTTGCAISASTFGKCGCAARCATSELGPNVELRC